MKFTLKIARIEGTIEVEPCRTCKGTGKVQQPATMTANGLQARGTGHPIPCPDCRGTKTATRKP